MEDKGNASKQWRPDPMVAANYDTSGWPSTKLGWELQRRGALYQRAWQRINRGKDRDAKMRQAKFEGPLWGLKLALPYDWSWERVERHFGVQLWPSWNPEMYRGLVELPIDGGRVLKGRLERATIDLGLCIGDTRILELQFRRLAVIASNGSKQYAKKLKTEVRTNPRINSETVGRYLRLLDLDTREPRLQAKEIGRVLYGKQLESKQLSKRLNKDRREADFLASYGYVKFYVRHFEDMKK